MKKSVLFISILCIFLVINVFAKTPIYVAFLWHMHQPIYWPGENIVETSHNPKCTDSVIEYLTWPDRVDAYTHLPIDTIDKFKYLPHAGAQISFSGSLIEDIDSLADSNIGYGRDWADRYRQGASWKTELGNPRIDLVGFGYFHPLMAFLDYNDIRRHIQMHRAKIEDKFNVPGSKGIFPPENAFSESMIPALVDEGFQWVLVDNLHFDHANRSHPWVKSEKIIQPNKADMRNNSQSSYISQHCQTNTTQNVSVPFSYQPHYVEYIDPNTGRPITPEGKDARIIAVPTARSIGYDDSYGDRSPISRLKELQKYNNDPDHPILVVIAHDGDNAGASGYRYYLETCSWIGENPDDFQLTTVQDYIDMYPPKKNDIIHVEDGSWVGADLGCQEFKKWNGDPYKDGQVDQLNGVSSDRHSWASIVAANNILETAKENNSFSYKEAERLYFEGQTSCYWYWDGTYEWDDKPTLAANMAISKIGTDYFSDNVPPSIFPPQREPYNPGSYEFDKVMDNDFMVWTLVYDVSGLDHVILYYQDANGKIDESDMRYNNQNTWDYIQMTENTLKDAGSIKPIKKAKYFTANINGIKDKYLNYFVEAVDKKGNISRSDIKHVYVGANEVITVKSFEPDNPTADDIITIYSSRPGFVHWGVNGWTMPDESYISEDSTKWEDGKAVETPLEYVDGKYQTKIGPFDNDMGEEVFSVEFVLHYSDNTWDKDKTINIHRRTKEIKKIERYYNIDPIEKYNVIRSQIFRGQNIKDSSFLDKYVIRSIYDERYFDEMEKEVNR